MLSRSRFAVSDRMHSLPDAITNIGRGLELAQVLGSIVGRRPSPLTDAECGAFGVIGDEQRLSWFLPVGMADDLALRIGRAPTAAASSAS